MRISGVIPRNERYPVRPGALNSSREFCCIDTVIIELLPDVSISVSQMRGHVKRKYTQCQGTVSHSNGITMSSVSSYQVHVASLMSLRHDRQQLVYTIKRGWRDEGIR